MSPDGQRWVACRPGFFLPVRVLSALFRRLFLTQLRQAFNDQKLHFFNALAALQDPPAFARYLTPVADANWIVYAKKPFGGPERVLEYLGRYTHRVAISNNRLVEFTDGQIAFQWKDYRRESQLKVMRLGASEFTRRFLLHVLPSGLQRIRHYGLLANRHREAKLERCRQLLEAPPAPPPEEPLDYLNWSCPVLADGCGLDAQVSMSIGAGLSTAGVAPATHRPAVGNPCWPLGGWCSLSAYILSKLTGEMRPCAE
jgi:hypothetical protein